MVLTVDEKCSREIYFPRDLAGNKFPDYICTYCLFSPLHLLKRTKLMRSQSIFYESITLL
jgi:hypothetical protein